MVWFIFAGVDQKWMKMEWKHTLHYGGGGRRDGEGRVRLHA